MDGARAFPCSERLGFGGSAAMTTRHFYIMAVNDPYENVWLGLHLGAFPRPSSPAMATHPVVRRALGSIKMGKTKPIWLDTVARLYPPITFSPPDYVKRTPAGRVPKPPRIVFPEDVFRRKFFADHPLEALRSSTMDERVKLDNSQAGRAIHPDSYSSPSHCCFA